MQIASDILASIFIYIYTFSICFCFYIFRFHLLHSYALCPSLQDFWCKIFSVISEITNQPIELSFEIEFLFVMET